MKEIAIAIDDRLPSVALEHERGRGRIGRRLGFRHAGVEIVIEFDETLRAGGDAFDRFVAVIVNGAIIALHLRDQAEQRLPIGEHGPVVIAAIVLDDFLVGRRVDDVVVRSLVHHGHLADQIALDRPKPALRGVSRGGNGRKRQNARQTSRQTGKSSLPREPRECHENENPWAKFTRGKRSTLPVDC